MLICVSGVVLQDRELRGHPARRERAGLHSLVWHEFEKSGYNDVAESPCEGNQIRGAYEAIGRVAAVDSE